MTAQRVIYLEPSSGISGDMFIGAFLDLGADFDGLRQDLLRLPVSGYQLGLSKCMRAGIHASKFDVHQDAGHTHKHGHAPHAAASHGRNFLGIRDMIESSALSPWVKSKSIETFRRLAEAEGKIHNQPAEKVHFHEVGAVDSIVDIVGSMIVLEKFLPARVLSAPINVGAGTLECQHGIYPVPGPATQELLSGIPVFSNTVAGELATPTGAALVAALVESFGPRPLMKVLASGYGAGTRDTPGNANVLRITMGELVLEADAAAEDNVAVIEAAIDDMNPQIFGYLQEKALNEGALDAYFTPIQMKKNRPAVQLTVVCAVDRHEALARLIFAETTTLGLRYTFARRKILRRESIRVNSEFGPVTIKVGYLAGQRINFAPEYEDCRRLAAETGMALKEVLAEATRAYLRSAE